MLLGSFLLILILVALNGFFVSVEFAAIASKRARIELLADEGSVAAQQVKVWLENPSARDRLIAASQLGITIVSLALGAIGEKAFEQLLAPLFAEINLPANWQIISPIMASLPLILSLIIVTSLHVVLGEQVPKVATLHTPERFALLAARPMHAFSTVFKWFIDILDWATRQILTLVGLQMVGEHLMVYSVDELKQIITESEEGGVIEAPAREMLESIFSLGELLVRQMMIPRTEIEAVEADTPLDELIQLVTQSRHTKFPVYEDNLDQVIGILHAKELLRIMYTEDCKECSARKLSREAIYVPETLAVDALLHQFRAQRQHIAIVLDEYGGTAGLVTLEDLLEEIVGEVSDPFDKRLPDIQTLADGSVLIDGMTLIEDVNEQLDLNLHDPDYDTIAGFVLGRLGRMARAGDVIDNDGVRLRVEVMDGLRIAQVSLTRIPPTLPAAPSA
jgi:CBS domain containing-hemolysin-like protein